MSALVDSIDWESFSHAYGPAVDTRAHLLALLSSDADARSEARSALSLSVIHQCSHWPGSPQATRCLVDIALTPGCFDLPDLIELITYLTTSVEQRAWGSVKQIALLLSDRVPDAQLWKDSYDAVAQRIEEFTALLSATHSAVRVGVAHLCGWFPGRFDSVYPALLKALEDPSDRVRGTAALSLATLCFLHGSAAPIDQFRGLLAPHDDSFSTFGAAVALVWSGIIDEPAVLTRLQDAIGTIGSRAETPWGSKACFLALEPFAPYSAKTPSLLVQAVYETLDDSSSNSWRSHFENLDLIRVILDVVFPSQEGLAPYLFEELTPRQKQMLRAVVRSRKEIDTSISHVLEHRGLPEDIRRLRVFVGFDPPDAAETRYSLSTPTKGDGYWPLWRILYEIQSDEGHTQVWAETLAKHISSSLLLDLASGTVFEMMRSWPGPTYLVMSSLAAALKIQLGTDVIPEVRPKYGEYPRWQNDDLTCQAVFSLWIAECTQRERLTAPSSDPLIALALCHAPPVLPWFYDSLEARPLAERARLILQRLDDVPKGSLEDPSSSPSSPKVYPAPWLYLDLAPTAAVAKGVVNLCARLNPWDFPLNEVLLFLSKLSSDVWRELDSLKDGPQERARELLRRASLCRQATELSNDMVRWELRQWVRDGACIGSGPYHALKMLPCPLCAKVFHELRIAPQNIGENALGYVEAPRRVYDDVEREEAWVTAHWQPMFQGVHVRVTEPWSSKNEDPAIREAVDNVLLANPDLSTGDISCVELRALHRFAKQLRAVFRSRTDSPNT